MELDLNMLKPQERVSLQLQLLYEQAGFRHYRMGRFEEYGLYQENRRFLPSEQVITFTDQKCPGGARRLRAVLLCGKRLPSQSEKPYLPGDPANGSGVHRRRG